LENKFKNTKEVNLKFNFFCTDGVAAAAVVFSLYCEQRSKADGQATSQWSFRSRAS
jgi:hypothetical protein